MTLINYDLLKGELDKDLKAFSHLSEWTDCVKKYAGFENSYSHIAKYLWEKTNNDFDKLMDCLKENFQLG